MGLFFLGMIDGPYPDLPPILPSEVNACKRADYLYSLNQMKY